MLPILNLQFSSLENLDAGLASPGLAPPDTGGTAAAGFAELLRLKFDSTLAETRTTGQLLPQAGSALPATPEGAAVELIEGTGRELADQALRTPALDQQLLAASPGLVDGVEPQIELSLPVRYPVIEELTGEAVPNTEAAEIPRTVTGTVLLPVPPIVPDSPELPALPVPGGLPYAGAAPPVTQAALTLMSNDAPTPRLPSAPPIGTGPLEGRLSEIGLQQRVQLMSQSVASDSAATGSEQRPVIDLSRRPETIPLQGPVSATEDISDVFKARPTVLQTVQVLNAQANPQQPQPVFSGGTAAPPVSESSYAAAAQQASDQISTYVRDAAWGDRLGDRVLMMAGNQVRTAEIRLTPAELGPLRIQVALDDGAANVTFQAQHAVTRDAIEQALPRLREMLAENGLSLGQTDVGEQGVFERNRDQQAETAVSEQSGDEVADVHEEPVPSDRVTVSNGLVDTFA